MIGHKYRGMEDKDEEEVRNEHEERERNIMKEILKAKHLKHRQFVEKLKKKEEEIKQQEENIPLNSAYINRRYHSSKIKTKIQNERMKNLLTKVDVYLKKIDIDSVEILKFQAEKEFEREKSKKVVGKEEMDKILTRLNKLNKKNEIEKDKNKTKIQLREKSKNRTTNANIRASSTTKSKETKIIPNKIMNIEKNLLFQLEDSPIGTNSMPNQIEDGEHREISETKSAIKQVRRIYSAKSSTSIKSKRNVETLPKINEKTKAETELRKILKQGNDLQSLKQFKRQYKWFDISPYIHKAQIEMIKTKSVVTRGKSAFKQSNIEKITRDAGDKLSDDNIRECKDADVENSKISNAKIYNLCNSYLNSCIYNNTEYIQLHLLSSRDDDDILDKINQKDEFNRKGIFYLIFHMNYPMIKVTLSSGLVLSDCVDIYGRNLLHYSAMIDNIEIMEVLCRCFSFEYKEDFEGMKKFLIKSFVNKTNGEQTDNMDTCESYLKEVLIKMENNIANKIDVQYSEDNIQRHTVVKSKINNLEINDNGKEEIINTFNPTIITHNKYFYFDEIKRAKMPLSNVINAADTDGKTAIFFAAENDNLDIIKCLTYYNGKTDLKDCHDKRPIDYATSDIIHKYILSHTKISKQKVNANADRTLILNKETVLSKKDENNQNEILQIRNLKYIPEEKINKLSLGHEHNSYLINSIIHDNFESFSYLIKSKNADIRLRNSNGWNALHFIISYKRYKYLSYLFLTDWNIDDTNNHLDIVCGDVSKISNASGGDDNCSEIDRIYDSLMFKEYSANDIFNAKGLFNILGNSFAILDVLTNNQLNILFMALDIKNLKESTALFKIICILLMKRESLQGNSFFAKEKISTLGIILNRKYDKSEKTLLLRAIESKNFEVVDYLINKIKSDYSNLYFSTEKEKKNLNYKIQVNLYETDKLGANALHYSVKFTKDPKFIKFFIKIDAEKNLLRTMEDSLHKVAQDYDSSKQLHKYFTHIWDAARLNDHILVEKIVSEDLDTSINEQSILVRNTPLHVAAMNCADKVSLYLISNNAQLDLKNSKKQTALDIAVELAKASDSAKLFLRKFKAILNKEIIDYIQLDSQNKTTSGNSLIMNLSFASVKNIAINKKVADIFKRIRAQIIERKLNFKKIFDIVDENKNGKLEGHEFESLFTVLDIQGVNRDDILLMMSNIDTNRNGIIEYGEFLKALENE